MLYTNWAVITPMANESKDFTIFIDELTQVLNRINGGTVYLIIDKSSKDQTLTLCRELSFRDKRFKTIWAPENRNVVDAYMRGYLEAYNNNHDFILEMDAGMSHDPGTLPLFLNILTEGYECVFGSRFIAGGSMGNSPYTRRYMSKLGTLVSNLFLGTRMCDMTSGFQGFQRHIAGSLINYRLLSKAHFYQTEVRYLLRKKRFAEIPIHYQASRSSLSGEAIRNSLFVLIVYTFNRILGKPTEL